MLGNSNPFRLLHQLHIRTVDVSQNLHRRFRALEFKAEGFSKICGVILGGSLLQGL